MIFWLKLREFAIFRVLFYFIVFLSIGYTSSIHAQNIDLGRGQSDIPDHFVQPVESFDFVRTEVMIPMRDGKKLFTVIISPKDVNGKMPIILTRTPYSAKKRTGQLASPHAKITLRPWDGTLVNDGYVLVFQDSRGKHDSEGRYILNLPLRGPLNSSQVDHSTDTWDTIDWLVKNVPNNNGRVGITGISYDGFLTLMALINPHPALKAAVPVNAMVDCWIGDDWYHNGALREVMAEYLYMQTATKDSSQTLAFGSYDTYQVFLKAVSAGNFGKKYGLDQLPAWNRIIDNPAYTAIWQRQAVQDILKKIKLEIPVLTVHSLFDQEDIFGPIASYNALETRDLHNNMNYLVIGPWHHGQYVRNGSHLGAIPWDSDTARDFRNLYLKPFWDEHLKGKSPRKPLSPVVAFETGTNHWKDYASWPPVQKVKKERLYLHADGKLSFTKTDNRQEKSYSEYVSDPATPVPYRVLPIRPLYANNSTWREWLADDQRQFSTRTDVLTFYTTPLKEAVTISGPIKAVLSASTSGTDSDWVVKLIDVYPDEMPWNPELGGYQLMISMDIVRGRYRKSQEKPAPIKPNAILPYSISLPPANHTYLPGHRIAVQIQSSLFPLYDRNPQTYVDNIAYAPESAYKVATQRIYHSPKSTSFIELFVNTKR